MTIKFIKAKVMALLTNVRSAYSATPPRASLLWMWLANLAIFIYIGLSEGGLGVCYGKDYGQIVCQKCEIIVDIRNVYSLLRV